MPKTIVITGASDGIGAAAARKLHADGHRVVVVGRSPEKTAAVAGELGVGGFVADFAVLDDVRRLATEIDSLCPTIDVLANNAGGVFAKQEKTVDGHDKTFQVNHLAPFLLTKLLLEKLIASRASVIQTASVGARALGKIEMDDLEHERDWSSLRAYGTTKLENILFTVELARRHGSEGISTAAFHPGVVSSNFAAEAGGLSAIFYKNPLSRLLLTSPEKGAGQLVWLAEGAPGTDWQSGAYYEKRKPASRMNPQARDPELASWLWEQSEAMLAD
jgi:NAD(P)-dependent dehydrogenase (short-subunit alcohol dehydrogenase family)